MSMNWVDGLDMLAQNGVLNYDAASYVAGTSPRYVPGVNMPCYAPSNVRRELTSDEYHSINQEEEIKNPLWKKLIMGGLIAIFGTYALIKGGKSFKKGLDNMFSSNKYKNFVGDIGEGLKKAKDAIVNFFKHPIKTIKSIFKK